MQLYFNCSVRAILTDHSLLWRKSRHFVETENKNVKRVGGNALEPRMRRWKSAGLCRDLAAGETGPRRTGSNISSVKCLPTVYVIC